MGDLRGMGPLAQVLIKYTLKTTHLRRAHPIVSTYQSKSEGKRVPMMTMNETCGDNGSLSIFKVNWFADLIILRRTLHFSWVAHRDSMLCNALTSPCLFADHPSRCVSIRSDTLVG